MNWKRVALLLNGFVLGLVSLQAQINEQFTDGELLNNPAWQGDLGNFIVDGAQRLQLNAPAVSDTSYLSTSLSLDFNSQIVWEFWMELNFSPSNSNNARFYLASSSPNLSASLDGYYVRLGENGDLDALKLYRQNGNTSTLILTGSVNTYPTNPLCRVRIVREANGIWSISSDPTGGSNFVAEGSATDSGINSMIALGWYCKYSTTNSTAFLLDDVVVTGNVLTDSEAPEALNAIATGPTTLDVYFNEPLSAASANNEANYSAEGMAPLSAELDNVNPSLVHLIFGSPFAQNTELELQITSIQDLSGNTLTSQTITFIYVVSGVAGSRDVVINEIFPDVSPSFGLPEYEYIELYNPGEEFYDLGGWELVNTTTPMTLPSVVLGPGEYLIITSGSGVPEYELFGNTIGLGAFVALTNGGDSLSLLNQFGDIIDVVSYDLSWYQDPDKEDGGWALEQINPLLACSGALNWIASDHPGGGTPGFENTHYDPSPDTTSPSLLYADYPAEGVIGLMFDESLAEGAADNLEVIVENGPSVILIETSADAAYYTAILDAPLDTAVVYTISVTGASDCSGNSGPLQTTNLMLGYEPVPGDLKISEIMADPNPPLGLPDAEYLEILNASDKVLELNGCRLSGNPLPSKILQPGEYAVIVDDATKIAEPFFANAVAISAWSSTYLTNSGRSLSLWNSSGVMLDSLAYSMNWYNDGTKDDGGWSMELINPNDPCSDQSNWRASISDVGGTPFSQNSVFDTSPDLIAPKLDLVFVQEADLIELIFSEPIDADIALSANYSFGGGLTVDEISLIGNPATSVLIEVNPNLQSGIEYTISISGIADCWGNVSEDQTSTFALPDANIAGDLIINEILSDPKSGGDDFVEIYNRSARNISLAGWQLASDNGGFPSNFNTISDLPYMLFPGEYMVLTRSKAGILPFYPRAKQDRILEMESLPSYNNDEGVVYLVTPMAEVSDRVAYTAEWHFALLDDTDGVSLERIGFDRPSEDATNWHSAAETEGFATPGYRNSQSVNALLEEGSFTASPELFSPDNDGYNDVVTLSYRLDDPGMVGNVSIFDDGGRLIRRLVQSDLLGTEGSWSWDGITDDKEKAPIGIYAVVFEVFGLNGEVKVSKAICVLAHRL